MATGLAGLKELGIAFPARPGKLLLLQRLFWTRWCLRRKNLTEITVLPEQADPLQIVAMDLLIALSASAYYLDPMLCASSILKMVEIALKHPNVKHTPVAEGSYAVVASLIFGTSKHLPAGTGGVEPWRRSTITLRSGAVMFTVYFLNESLGGLKTNLDYQAESLKMP